MCANIQVISFSLLSFILTSHLFLHSPLPGPVGFPNVPLAKTLREPTDEALKSKLNSLLMLLKVALARRKIILFPVQNITYRDVTERFNYYRVIFTLK